MRHAAFSYFFPAESSGLSQDLQKRPWRSSPARRVTRVAWSHFGQTSMTFET
jgi:hypothetical protein